MSCSLISPKARLSVNTLPFYLKQYLISGENYRILFTHMQWALKWVSHSSPHIPISVTNAPFIKLCFQSFWSHLFFPSFLHPSSHHLLTSFYSLSNCWVLTLPCFPALLSVFFGHFKNVSVLLTCASSSLHTSMCLSGPVSAKLIPNINTLGGFLPFCCLIWKKKPNSKYCTATP